MTDREWLVFGKRRGKTPWMFTYDRPQAPSNAEPSSCPSARPCKFRSLQWGCSGESAATWQPGTLFLHGHHRVQHTTTSQFPLSAASCLHRRQSPFPRYLPQCTSGRRGPRPLACEEPSTLSRPPFLPSFGIAPCGRRPNSVSTKPHSNPSQKSACCQNQGFSTAARDANRPATPPSLASALASIRQLTRVPR
jgi:hypothetical protein